MNNPTPKGKTMKTQKTNVVFRIEGKNDVVALLWPDSNTYGRMTCYDHVGQHGEADWLYRGKRKATPEEYAPLLAELTHIGYDVTVKQRVNLDEVRKGWA